MPGDPAQSDRPSGARGCSLAGAAQVRLAPCKPQLGWQKSKGWGEGRTIPSCFRAWDLDPTSAPNACRTRRLTTAQCPHPFLLCPYLAQVLGRWQCWAWLGSTNTQPLSGGRDCPLLLDPSPSNPPDTSSVGLRTPTSTLLVIVIITVNTYSVLTLC